LSGEDSSTTSLPGRLFASTVSRPRFTAMPACHCSQSQFLLLFATVPESSINSWVSWFIFNLHKINIH
jgi:hypothetical protein